jgi:restriction system protein
VVQAKRYGYKNCVSLSAVQEVYGAKAYYRANQAWVVTNSYFTKQAKELAAACDVKLIDREELQALIHAINPTFKAKEIYENVTPEARNCPACGKQLVVRQGKVERFFGCFSFPACHHTEKINKWVRTDIHHGSLNDTKHAQYIDLIVLFNRELFFSKIKIRLLP